MKQEKDWKGWFECASCFAVGPYSTIGETDALKKWNTRAALISPKDGQPENHGFVSTIPEDWKTASYGECAGAGEKYIEMLQDTAAKAKLRPFMPADKVRDVRDFSKRTWRILEVSASWDKTKIVLQDVHKPENKIVGDYHKVTPYLSLIAAPKDGRDGEGKS